MTVPDPVVVIHREVQQRDSTKLPLKM